ncbi:MULTISPECIES: hypothetical protein [Streptomyces]|uniref:hypothetical protein n=1 Tax=Streptomyces lycopersici TaxID=2974589 RepID=UPI0021CE190D|nr:hypothetical protein [Streptomyces sp. NEAU-383]
MPLHKTGRSGRRAKRTPPLTHAALDELPEGKAVEHIRSILVTPESRPGGTSR